MTSGGRALEGASGQGPRGPQSPTETPPFHWAQRLPGLPSGPLPTSALKEVTPGRPCTWRSWSLLLSPPQFSRVLPLLPSWGAGVTDPWGEPQSGHRLPGAASLQDPAAALTCPISGRGVRRPPVDPCRQALAKMSKHPCLVLVKTGPSPPGPLRVLGNPLLP